VCLAPLVLRPLFGPALGARSACVAGCSFWFGAALITGVNVIVRVYSGEPAQVADTHHLSDP